MATGYIEFPNTEKFITSLPKILSNDKAALTWNAGTAFPTAGLSAGMPCFRTDQQKLYGYDGKAWQLLLDLKDMPIQKSVQPSLATKTELANQKTELTNAISAQKTELTNTISVQKTELIGAINTKASSSHKHAIVDLPKASVAEAQAGTDDTKVMTPSTTKSAILTLSPPPDLSGYATKTELNNGLNERLNTKGGTLTGDLVIAPSGAEGGQIELRQGTNATNGVNLDTTGNQFRVFGTPNVGTVFGLNPQNGNIDWGGHINLNGVIRRNGTSASWRAVLDERDTGQSSFIYQRNHTGYMPAINLCTSDGRVGFGAYISECAWTYFLNSNTTNSADCHVSLTANWLSCSKEIRGSVIRATSDIRLKSDLEPISNNVIDGLKAYRYTLKADKKKHIGLIAQDVIKVLPEAVSTDDKGFYSLDYNAIVAVLVDKVNALEKRIKELESK